MNGLLSWKPDTVIGGTLYRTEILDDYEILEKDGKFYARRLVADCQDVGPLDTFKKAEDVILTLNTALVEYEEATWRVLAAQALQAAGMIAVAQVELPLGDGTVAGTVET